MDNNQVLDLFVSRSMIDGALKADVLSEIENSGKEAAEILADYQVISSRDDVWPIIAQELGAEFVDLSEFEPPEALLSLVPAGMARLHGALPVAYNDGNISVALTDPL
ncbi:pilus assembly protein PilB, partial [bacterium]|nr:pilus assembly protein PilB [bacterium]